VVHIPTHVVPSEVPVTSVYGGARSSTKGMGGHCNHETASRLEAVGAAEALILLLHFRNDSLRLSRDAVIVFVVPGIVFPRNHA
jgi:hypothetical protein